MSLKRGDKLGGSEGGATFREIAKEMGTSRGTVWTLYLRALRKLRRAPGSFRMKETRDAKEYRA